MNDQSHRLNSWFASSLLPLAYNSTHMKIKITDTKGQVVDETAVYSTNHYLMLLSKLEKKKTYTVDFIEGGKKYSRTIVR